MNVGFYYHIPMKVTEGGVCVPEHLGRFLEELARQAGFVTFYGHAVPDGGGEGMWLAPPLLRPVDLGPRRSFPARTFNPRPALERFQPSSDGVDVLLIRGPSPLLPALARAARPTPVAVWLQGDYATGPAPRWMPAWRRAATRGWKILYTFEQRRAVRGRTVLVNSPPLAARLGGAPATVGLVVSSAVREAEVAAEPVPSTLAPLARFHLVYAGRIAEEKGLLETVESLGLLVREGIDADLVLYGEAEHPAFLSRLERLMERAGVRQLVKMGGMLSLSELARRLRQADALVLASYHEGFPHVVIEAMAAGLPVVASRVGGIPHLVEDGRHVLLVEPRSPSSLAHALRRLYSDAPLRHRLAEGGLEWARSHTLERSVALVVSYLTRLVS